MLLRLAALPRLRPSGGAEPGARSPFLERLSRAQRWSIGLYLAVGFGLGWILLRSLLPLLWSQVALVPMVLDGLLRAVRRMDGGAVWECCTYLALPLFIAINLGIVVVRTLMLGRRRPALVSGSLQETPLPGSGRDATPGYPK